MKFNPIEKIRRIVMDASRPSLILFILCCVGGFSCLLTNFESVSVLLTGLMGVLWLSSIALHSMKKRGVQGRQRNPFTLLVILCLAVFVGCQWYAKELNAPYFEEHEPFNRFSDNLAESIAGQAGELETGHINHEYQVVLNDGITANIIVTDRNYNVIYTQNAWKAGSKVLRPLISPSRQNDGDALLLLLDEHENVVASFIADDDWIDESMGEGTPSLTITDEEAARDPLYEKYFPSFGKYIDQAALWLSRTGRHIVLESEERISLSDWKGEPILRILNTGEAIWEEETIAELNNLTDEERERFIQYMSWLDSACSAAGSLRARMMSSANGEFHAFLLYEDDYEALYPYKQEHNERLQLRGRLLDWSLCMIPAAIVFLAFWVFVDARKRGQKNPALWAMLTLIGNAVAWIVYMMTRPQLMQTPAGQSISKGACPICGTKLKSDFIACPGCGILLRSRCKNCGRALENDWSFCPYCTQAVVKEIPAPAGEEEAAE